MAQNEVENRGNRRFPLALPVAVKGARQESRTRDVSARSAFFYTDAAPEVGSEVEFTFTLPAEMTLTEAFLVQCKGKVVRVDVADGKIGVAAIIRQYDLIPQA